MRTIAGLCWGVIPARGGSKTIPLKNLAPLAGRPLIDYSVLAAEACSAVSRLICSTDSDRIADHCRSLGVEVHQRPARLGADSTPVFDVIAHLLNDIAAREDAVAEFVALLQPTSPFLLPEHIEACVRTLIDDRQAESAQTVVPCPHSQHAINQRVVVDGQVAFRFSEERRRAPNKQSKQPHWLFGNLVVFRSTSALEQGSVFAEPSLAVPISRPYDLDADEPQDFELAELMVAHGFVDLPHLCRGARGKARRPSTRKRRTRS